MHTCAVVLDQHKIQQLQTEKTSSTYCCFQRKKDIRELWHEATQVCFNFHNTLSVLFSPSTRRKFSNSLQWIRLTECNLGKVGDFYTCWIVNQSVTVTTITSDREYCYNFVIYNATYHYRLQKCKNSSLHYSDKCFFNVPCHHEIYCIRCGSRSMYSTRQSRVLHSHWDSTQSAINPIVHQTCSTLKSRCNN